MKFATKTITPEFARAVLATKNPRNRRINPNLVKMYVSDMRQGVFILTHQGVAFDENGDLLDGQNRLAAVVEFGKPVEMIVATHIPCIVMTTSGIPVKYMDAVDRGGKRSQAQQIGMDGDGKFVSCKVAACNQIRSQCCSKDYRSSSSTAQIRGIMEIYRTSFDAVMEQGWQKADRKAHIIGTMVLFHAGFPEEQAQFSAGLINMDGLKHKSPIIALRKFLTNTASGSRVPRTPHFVANACVKFLDGENVDVLRDSTTAMDRILAAQKAKVRKVRELVS